MPQASASSHHQVVIIGGGTAGTTVAASLLRQRPSLQVTVIEPSARHYYQPAFTLVGGGVYDLADTFRPQQETLPSAASWLQAAVTAIEPEANRITLDDGRSITYDFAVVAPGIKLDWDRVDGLREALGSNGVCSNYSPQHVAYTWMCLQQFSGGNAVFTQAPPPIKCAGAPQKIAYLTAHRLQKKKFAAHSKLYFYNGGASLFSVPDFIPHLQRVMDRYGIQNTPNHDLLAVDAKRKVAIFQQTDGERRQLEQPFDMLHVTPHQCAPDFIRNSTLANADGWVEVDKNTTRHLRFANVFGLGDASSLPTSKTAAAIRKQAPVTVKNLLAAIDGRTPTASYDGYTSCPLITSYGTVMLAEFVYDAVVTPTLPLNPFQESRFYWMVKRYLLPPFYWNQMLRGKEPDIQHKARQFRH